MAWSLVPTANSLQLGKVKLECVSHLLFHNMLNLIQKKLLYIDPDVYPAKHIPCYFRRASGESYTV